MLHALEEFDESLFFDGNFSTVSSSERESIGGEGILKMEETSRPLSKKANLHGGAHYMNLLIFALNSCDPVVMDDLLSRICDPSVLVNNYGYASPDNVVTEADTMTDSSSPELFQNFPPITGLGNFIAYWDNMQKTFPDCIISMKTPSRSCVHTKREAVYAIGIQFQGTCVTVAHPHAIPMNPSLVITSPFVFSPFAYGDTLPVFRVSRQKMEKNGSIIIYVNKNGFISRIDLYLEW